MSKRFSAVYLTLLVMLTGALVLAPAVTTMAAATDITLSDAIVTSGTSVTVTVTDDAGDTGDIQVIVDKDGDGVYQLGSGSTAYTSGSGASISTITVTAPNSTASFTAALYNDTGALLEGPTAATGTPGTVDFTSGVTVGTDYTVEITKADERGDYDITDDAATTPGSGTITIVDVDYLITISSSMEATSTDVSGTIDTTNYDEVTYTVCAFEGPIPSAGASYTAQVSTDLTIDDTVPTVDEVKTFDQDNDGKVDAAQVKFSESVDDSSITHVGYFEIGNAAAESFSTNRIDGTTDTDADDEYISLTIDTDANEVSGTDLKALDYVTGSELADLAGNYLATGNDLGTTTKTDAAEPTVNSAAYTAGADKADEQLAVTFSEDISIVGATSDYSVLYDPDGNFGTTGDQRPVTVNGVSASAAVVTLTIADQSQQTDTGGNFKVEVANPGNVMDSSGNGVNSSNASTSTGTIDNFDQGNLPTMNSAETTAVDTIDVTFSENLDVSTLAKGDFDVKKGTTISGEAVGTGDGSTTVFTLDNSPVVQGSETIYVDASSVSTYTIDYTTGQITFVSAPASGKKVTAGYDAGYVVSNAALSGDTVTLTLGSDMATDAVPDVTYTQGTLADIAGNLVATTTKTPSDGVAPTMNSAETKTTTTIHVTFSEGLNNATLDKTDFSVAGVSNPLSGASETGGVVTLTLASADAIATDAKPDVTYTQGTLADSSGNLVASGTITDTSDGVGPVLQTIDWNDVDDSDDITEMDTLVFTFSEPILQSTITSANVATVLEPNSNGYGSGATRSWDTTQQITVTMANGVDVIAGTNTVDPTNAVTDLAGNVDASSATDIEDLGGPVTLGTQNYPTIQAAIDAATGGADEIIEVAAAYDFTDDEGDTTVTVNKAGLTIKAADSANPPVIDSNGQTVFNITTSGTDVTLKDLTIENSGSTADLITVGLSDAGLILDNCTVDLTKNAVGDNGLKITGATDNLVLEASVTNGTTFSLESSDVGILSGETNIVAQVDVTNTTFSGPSGTAIDDGGNGLESVITGSTFDETQYGVTLTDATSKVTISGTTFQNGTYDSGGAAIKVGVSLTGGYLRVYDSEFGVAGANAGYSVNASAKNNITLMFNNIVDNAQGMSSGTASLDATHNWWGQSTGSASGQAGSNVTTTDYLGASVDVAKYISSSSSKLGSATSSDKVGVSVNPGGGEELAVATYASNPQSTFNNATFYDVYAGGSNNKTIKFYSTSNKTPYYWNSSSSAWEQVTSSAVSYDAATDVITVSLDDTTSPAKSNLSPLEFALSGSSSRSMTVAQGWHMISVGFSPNNPAPAAVFGDSMGSVFAWNGSGYDSGSGISSIDPKEGYWFYSSSDSNTVDLGSGVNVESNVTIDTSSTGWYMISAPFNASWSQVTVEKGGHELSIEEASSGPDDKWLGSNLYTYEPDNSAALDSGYVTYDITGVTSNADTGYWIETKATDLTLKIPFSPAMAPSSVAELNASALIPASQVPEDASVPPAPPKAFWASTELNATALSTAEGVTFKVSGADVSSINVQVFSTNGEEIFANSAEGNSLNWDANVANGIYLYGVSAKVNGETKPLGVQKLLILE